MKTTVLLHFWSGVRLEVKDNTQRKKCVCKCVSRRERKREKETSLHPQQALVFLLMPLGDSLKSNSSAGFRPPCTAPWLQQVLQAYLKTKPFCFTLHEKNKPALLNHLKICTCFAFSLKMTLVCFIEELFFQSAIWKTRADNFSGSTSGGSWNLLHISVNFLFQLLKHLSQTAPPDNLGKMSWEMRKEVLGGLDWRCLSHWQQIAELT